MDGDLLNTAQVDLIHAEAIIENEDESIGARIAPLFDRQTILAHAMTNLDLPDTDLYPSISCECLIR